MAMLSAKREFENRQTRRRIVMNGSRREFLTVVSCVLVIFVVSTAGINQGLCAERYPAKAIDIIAPFAAGGSADILARFIGDNLRKKWGVPVNVVNKPGGNTVPASLELYNARPDGYTMFSDSQSSSSLMEVAIKDLPFKVLDRTFIGFIAASPHVLYVKATSPIKGLKDVEAEFKHSPETATWGSFGGVGAADFMMRQFFKEIGVDVTKTKPVICRGGAESVSLTAGGNLKFGPASPASGIPMVKGGMIRAVAVTRFKVAEFPDVPTAAEQGYPGVNAVYWAGISGPPKLPPDIVAKWDQAMQEMLKDPDFLSKVQGVGFVPFYRSPRDATEYVKKEMEEVAKLWGVK
jgi:tripartite-type tricarboxylate transporter receptor subunit TctC